MANDSFTVLQHLHKHASTFGLDASSLNITNSKNTESAGNRVSVYYSNVGDKIC